MQQTRIGGKARDAGTIPINLYAREPLFVQNLPRMKTARQKIKGGTND
jgi:hypothetical protein